MRSATVLLGSALLALSLATPCHSARCNRLIEGATMPKSSAESKYHFFMTLHNRTEIVYAYMPNTKYTVTLVADSLGPMPRKFSRFLISAEPQNFNETADSGVFDLQDDMMSSYSETCPNAVVESSKVLKETVSVVWNSPSEGSGCIYIRATVMETPDTWYMDDSNLVLTMCQDAKAEADEQGPILEYCCACDEAKYEVTFEGLWSRNTHPKDFPSKGWLIRFSDVIGASHSVNYTFWKYNGMASKGLRQVAELGSTRRLESELKDRSEHIRTIIKARGISYPNVTGRTFAVFRVDKKHHLMSLVSMIDPSPDWLVGVSSLELCLVNCSWIEHKELNLYPYDAGTDDGITYLSPDQPTEPQEPIRKITSSYPNDSRSPFYDPSGLDMKPMARLYLKRQRLYEKTCDDGSEENPDAGGDPSPASTHDRPKNKACRVTPWGPWTDCSVTCGKGSKLRQRKFKDEAAATFNRCTISLTDRRTCYGESPHCDNGRDSGILETEMCDLTPWSAWSECTTTCGPGTRTRSRNYVNKKYRKQCRAAAGAPRLQQNIKCNNDPCEGDDGNDEVREESENDDEEPLEDSGDLNEEDEGDEEEDEENNGGERGDDENEGEEGEEDEDEDEGEEDEDENANYAFVRDEVEVTEEWLQKCESNRFTEWSLWSPCSSTCGPGVKLRSRLLNKGWNSFEKPEEEDESLEECKIQQVACVAEIPTCDFSREEAEEICSEPMIMGSCTGNILRAYFDKHTGQCRLFTYSGCDGNRNNFQTEQDCNNVCGSYQREKQQSEISEFNGLKSGSQIVDSEDDYGEKVDCKMSDWSGWSHCVDCRGYSVQTRQVLVRPRNGGKNCPKKVTRRMKCRHSPPCSLRSDGFGKRYNRNRNSEIETDEVSIDCVVSSWSKWSHCTSNYGNHLQHRTRYVRVKPRGSMAKLCPHLAEFRECQVSSYE